MFENGFTFTKESEDSEETNEPKIKRLGRLLNESDAILVGAGAGLSTAAGFTYSGPRFDAGFSPWTARHGFTDFYTGGFHPYQTLEEFWGFWAKSILFNRYEAGVGAPYRELLDLLKDRDFFVLTTNVDHQFQLAGFPRERLFYTQGDYGLFQCSRPCCARTYDNEEQVRAMAAAVDEKIARQRAARIPERLMDLSVSAELVPRCPVCGAPMACNLRSDSTFVEDKGWHDAAARYKAFTRAHRRSRVLYLELGVGQNTPGIIKYPFWQMCDANPRATYACVNFGEAYCPAEIADRSLLINADISEVLRALK